MHAIVACQMEFQLYPMDIQVCPIYIESCKCEIYVLFVFYGVRKHWSSQRSTDLPVTEYGIL